MHHARNGFLTAKGLAEAAQRRVLTPDELELRLDGVRKLNHLDKVGSVSAVRRDERLFVDDLLEEQYRRFLEEVEVV